MRYRLALVILALVSPVLVQAGQPALPSKRMSPLMNAIQPGQEVSLRGSGPKGQLLVRPVKQGTAIQFVSAEFKQAGIARCDFRVVGLKRGMKISPATKWQISSATPIESTDWPGSLSYLVTTPNKNPKLSNSKVLSAYLRCQKNLGSESLADLGVRIKTVERQASN